MGSNYKKIGKINASAIAHPTDSRHEIYDARLAGGAVLHRFVNGANDMYSAIYMGNIEIMNIAREKELAMVAYYQTTYEERKSFYETLQI